MARQPSRKSADARAGDVSDKADRLKDDVVETAAVASDVAELAYEELAAQLEKLRQDLADLSDALAKAGRETAEDAKARARESFRQAGDSAAHAADQVEDLMRDAEVFARKRPGVAMGIAAALGFLLACAMSRR